MCIFVLPIVGFGVFSLIGFGFIKGKLERGLGWEYVEGAGECVCVCVCVCGGGCRGGDLGDITRLYDVKCGSVAVTFEKYSHVRSVPT
jgi:hypothetical protein